MPPRKRIDFSHFEPQYPRIFRLLRKAGWNELRDVDFPDVDQGDDGQWHGYTVLHDAAYSFLRSFYGLRIGVPRWYGETSFLIGFGPQWQRMLFDQYNGKVDTVARELADDQLPYPIITWDRCVAFLTEHRQRVLAIDDNYQICIEAQDPFQLMEWIIDRASQPGVVRHYLEYDQMPQEYWHLAAETHPLSFHLRQYRAHQLTEGERVTYVLEDVGSKVIEVEVFELSEQGDELSIKYRKHPWMADALARQMLIHKLLDEWLEGRFRQSTRRIRFENLEDHQVVVTEWPEGLGASSE